MNRKYETTDKGTPDKVRKTNSVTSVSSQLNLEWNLRSQSAVSRESSVLSSISDTSVSSELNQKWNLCSTLTESVSSSNLPKVSGLFVRRSRAMASILSESPATISNDRQSVEQSPLGHSRLSGSRTLSNRSEAVSPPKVRQRHQMHEKGNATTKNSSKSVHLVDI